jgi:hypothetical protein
MSLQQIPLESKGSNGIKKEINQNSIDIIFDALQVYAYSNPIDSTVRELTSNAVDAQREKEIAIEILDGKSEVADYFIEKHGKEFEDSKFDLNYYNKDWLDLTENEVELEYVSLPGSGFCDQFIVRDWGVGIGNGRLEGVLQLGYSSKRNTKELIGGFGMGQKAALSTGAPMYTMITAFQGKMFKFNIYSKKIDVLIGRFNEETGEENGFVTFNSGQKIYYEATTRKNFTEIIVPVKKLNEHKYSEAVMSQLLYLPGIRFFQTSDNQRRRVNFKANILYESSNIIISNNYRFSRPHLLVVKDRESNAGVCYNEIDYKELELEQKYGKVALKVQIRATGKDENGDEYLIHEGIAVTPNREQVIWNEDTKDYLLKITRGVSDEAALIIEKELKETDFLKWMNKAVEVTSNFSYGSVLYEISQMIDKSSIAPKYHADKTIKLNAVKDMFWGLNLRYVRTVEEYSRSSSARLNKVHRDVAEKWNMICGKALFFKTEETSHIKDRYIMSKVLGQDKYDQQSVGFVMVEYEDTDAMLDELIAKASTPAQKKEIETKFQAKLDRRDKIVALLKASQDVHVYDDVVVPDDFKVAAEESEAKIEALIREDTLSLEELRKANGEVVFFTGRPGHDWRHDFTIVMDKKTEKASDLPNLFGRLYYGFDEDRPKLEAACRLLGMEQSAWYNKELAIVKIAKNNQKHFRTVGEHISKFFYEINDKNEIIVTEEVSNYITARYISKALENHKLKFFRSYADVDKRLHDMYDHLSRVARTYFDSVSKISTVRDEAEKTLLETLLKYAEFQQFVKENERDIKAVANKSKELFTVDTFTGTNVLQLVEIERLKLLEEYAENVYGLFNHVDFLTNSSHHYPSNPEGISMIRVILREYNLEPFDVPEELLIKSQK